jgi:hypothetical protein
MLGPENQTLPLVLDPDGPIPTAQHLSAELVFSFERFLESNRRLSAGILEVSQTGKVPAQLWQTQPTLRAT